MTPILNLFCQMKRFVAYSNCFRNFVTCFDQIMAHYLQFWMSYVDLVSLLLNFIPATRERNWSLQLTSVRELILWCFAYKRNNYSRYLPWYYREMIRLPRTRPDLHFCMKIGLFSCQICSENTFGKIPIDQTTGETINKDTQTTRRN